MEAVSCRDRFKGSSAKYISGYIIDDFVLRAFSMDMIAKVAGRLEDMGTRILGKRKLKVRSRTRSKGAAS